MRRRRQHHDPNGGGKEAAPPEREGANNTTFKKEGEGKQHQPRWRGTVAPAQNEAEERSITRRRMW